MRDGNLRQLFRRHLPQVHWTTVETGIAESGVPDLHFCHEGRSGWVECKRAKSWEVSLRPMQVGWISRQVRCGGRVVIAVRRNEELYLLDGRYAGRARALGLRALPRGAVLGRWDGGPAHWGWGRVLALLGGSPGASRARSK